MPSEGRIVVRKPALSTTVSSGVDGFANSMRRVVVGKFSVWDRREHRAEETDFASVRRTKGVLMMFGQHADSQTQEWEVARPGCVLESTCRDARRRRRGCTNAMHGCSRMAIDRRTPAMVMRALCCFVSWGSCRPRIDCQGCPGESMEQVNQSMVDRCLANQ